MRERTSFEDNSNSGLVERYMDSSIPLKIRKTNLLAMCGLPIPESVFFDKVEIDNLDNEIKSFFGNDSWPLILRVACVPNKSSMPFFYINNEEEVRNVISEAQELLKGDSSIKSFILQEATPEEKAKEKISGRIVLESTRMIPTEQTVEIYKGARSTSILNNVKLGDPRLLRFQKKTGQFMKPEQEITRESNVSEGEIRGIFSSLKGYLEMMESVKAVIAKSEKKDPDNLSCSFEFSYRAGRITFIDID